MGKKYDLIRKPSAMIQTNVKELTLTQRKVINALIHVAQKTGDHKIYSIPLADVRKLCGVSHESNDDVKSQIRALTDIKIEYNYLGKDRDKTWGISVLLAGAEMKPNTGKVRFAFSPFIQEKILNPEIYAPLDVVLIAGLCSTYTIVLYEFLRDYLDSPKVPQMEIGEFRALMGIDDVKYKLFKDLRTHVIDKAAAEVNEKTDLLCRYELTKERGNRYAKIQWFVSRKTQRQESDVPLLEDHNYLPAAVLAALPEKHHTEAVFDVLRPYCADPFDEALVVSNVRYAVKNAKRNFRYYLSKALAEDFARAAREGESQERKIVDRDADDRRKEQEDRAAFERECEDRYMRLAVADLERLEAEVRSELRNEGVQDAFMMKGVVKARVIDRLMGISGPNEVKQESLF